MHSSRTNLVVTLLESLVSQPLPDILLVEILGHLERHLELATLDSEVEPRHLVLDKVESDLGETFLLEIGNDALTNEVRVSDDAENLVVVTLGQRKLESVFGRVDFNRSGLAGSVDTMDGLALDSREVDGLLKRLDDAGIAVDCTRTRRRQ